MMYRLRYWKKIHINKNFLLVFSYELVRSSFQKSTIIKNFDIELNMTSVFLLNPDRWKFHQRKPSKQPLGGKEDQVYF